MYVVVNYAQESYNSVQSILFPLYPVVEFFTMPLDRNSLHFIGEPIEVQFDQPSVLVKKPGCPDEFLWRGKRYRVVEKLGEWHDYGRRGRMASNMRPERARIAARHGSWGVGRDYFRVRTDTGQVFDLYYDRTPGSSTSRLGTWILYREMEA
jgi:hypothetical protein